jgi:hypothetical protein
MLLHFRASRSGAARDMAQGRLSVRKFAKGAGALLLGVIALDVVATLATLAIGWGMFKG